MSGPRTTKQGVTQGGSSAAHARIQAPLWTEKHKYNTVWVEMCTPQGSTQHGRGGTHFAGGGGKAPTLLVAAPGTSAMASEADRDSDTTTPTRAEASAVGAGSRGSRKGGEAEAVVSRSSRQQLRGQHGKKQRRLGRSLARHPESLLRNSISIDLSLYPICT